MVLGQLIEALKIGLYFCELAQARMHRCTRSESRRCASQLVAVYGSWHLGQLQVGLSKAKRLCRCSSVRITTSHMLPMQVRSPVISLLPRFACHARLCMHVVLCWYAKRLAPLQRNS